MNACPTPPATPVGFVGGILHRIVAFLALWIRASGLGTTQARTVQTRARIAAFAAGLLALTRTVARVAARPLRECGASSGASRATLPFRETFGWMVAFVPAALRDAVAGVIARGRRATLTEASWQATRAVRGRARGFGVVLPTAHFPTMDKPMSEAQATASEPAYDPASDALALVSCDRAPDTAAATIQLGSGLCKPALSHRVLNSVLLPGRVALSIARNGKHDPRQSQNAKAGADMVLSTGSERAPVANFRQAFATGMRGALTAMKRMPGARIMESLHQPVVAVGR